MKSAMRFFLLRRDRSELNGKDIDKSLNFGKHELADTKDISKPFYYKIVGEIPVISCKTSSSLLRS